MSKISEKLKYLRETKGLIREAIEEQGGIVEDTTPFREYADIIKNIPGNVGDLESWRKVELPVEFEDPKYFGPDSDHIFVTENTYSTQERPSNGLWLYKYSTNTWTQLYNELGGYHCMSQGDNDIMMFFPYSYDSAVTFDLLSYNLKTDEFKIVGNELQYKGYLDAHEFEHGVTFLNDGKHFSVWNKHLNQVTIKEKVTSKKDALTFGDYVIYDLNAGTVKIGNVQTGVINSMTSNYLIDNGTYLKILGISETKGLLSYGYSTSDANLLGLYLIDAETLTITKIYDDGYNWSHMQEFEDSYFINSTGSIGVLKVTKNDFTCTRIIDSGGAWDGEKTEDSSEGMVKLNERTILVVNISKDRRASLYDIIDNTWVDIIETSSYTRYITRGDNMFLITSGSSYSTVAHGISKISTVANPVYAKTTKAASTSDLYKTKWGFSFTVNGGGTTQVAGFAINNDGSIKTLYYDAQNYIRTVFKSRRYAYYYNNNTDDSHGLMVRIDPEDVDNMTLVEFGKNPVTGHLETYNLDSVYQGPDPYIYIYGYGILGVYNENDNTFKYYGDLGEHRDGYIWDKTLTRWPTYGDDKLKIIQAGPDYNYNWILRGTIFCDEKEMKPQYTFNVGNVWRNYTYNNYYLEDIRSRRMCKIVPDICNFTNYWLYKGRYDWKEQWFNFKGAISNKYILICKDGEE